MEADPGSMGACAPAPAPVPAKQATGKVAGPTYCTSYPPALQANWSNSRFCHPATLRGARRARQWVSASRSTTSIFGICAGPAQVPPANALTFCPVPSRTRRGGSRGGKFRPPRPTARGAREARATARRMRPGRLLERTSIVDVEICIAHENESTFPPISPDDDPPGTGKAGSWPPPVPPCPPPSQLRVQQSVLPPPDDACWSAASKSVGPAGPTLTPSSTVLLFGLPTTRGRSD